MNLTVPPLGAYCCRMRVVAVMALLYRIRIVLLFAFAGSVLYACGVWDMLNEVSIRENNGISWPVSSISLLAKHRSVNKSLSSTQYIQFGDGSARNASQTTSLVSSAASFYRSVSDGAAVLPAAADFPSVNNKSAANSHSSYYYSTTFYYIETNKKIISSGKQRARAKRRRMAVMLPQRTDGRVLSPLPVDSITADKQGDTGSSFVSGYRFAPKERPTVFSENSSYDSRSVQKAARADITDNSRAAVTDDSGDESSNVINERQRAFMVVYQVSSNDSNSAGAGHPDHHDNFLRILKEAGVNSDDDGLTGSSGYSPTATPNPLPPITMSLQPTPLPDISSSYFTSTMPGATNPTIREPHNYGEKSTTRRTYYQPIANNTRRSSADAAPLVSRDDDLDAASDADSDASTGNDGSWWLRPMKLTPALNISDFPFMQYIISPQCPLPLYNVPASERNAATLSDAEASRVVMPNFAVDVEHTTFDNGSIAVRHPNCPEAFGADEKYVGYNRTSVGIRRVLVLVKSAQAHAERRAAIRQTWGSHPQLDVRFLIGRTPLVPVEVVPSVDEPELLAENVTEHDGFTSWIHQAFATFLGNDTTSGSSDDVNDTSTTRSSRRAQRSAPETPSSSLKQQSLLNSTTIDAEEPIFDCSTPAECSLLQESRHFNDIILTDFVDNYYNNTFKTLSGIHWAVQFCRLGSIEYVLLSDDDMWLNPFNLLGYLENATRNGSISADRDLYMGDLFPNSKPMRIRWSKWYVPVSVYKFDRYPPYITASAILMSRSTLIKFAEESLHTELFMYDDIFLAILARQLGINATRNPLFSSFNRVDVLDQAQTDLFSSLIVSHGYGQPLTLLHAWNATVCQRLFGPPPASSADIMPHEQYSRTTLLPVDADHTGYYSDSQVSSLSSGPKTSLWRWLYSSVFGDADRPSSLTDYGSTSVSSSSSSDSVVMRRQPVTTTRSTPRLVHQHGT